jgi:hypothetical protein
MNVTRVKKTVVAVTLLLMFTMGGFALSLAHENVPASFALSLEMGLGLSIGTWQDAIPSNSAWHLKSGAFHPSFKAWQRELDSLGRCLPRTLILPFTRGFMLRKFRFICSIPYC